MDPVRSVFGLLRTKIEERGGDLRLASAAEGRANVCRALCWTGQGAFALKPHDDAAQVLHAGDGFEFASAGQQTVVAINFYASMPDYGGDLRLWNYKPSVEEKEAAGIEKTGYPYSLAALAGYRYHDFGICSGDLVLIDGGFVHAVTRQSPEGTRLLLHAFVGFVDERDAVWWT